MKSKLLGQFLQLMRKPFNELTVAEQIHGAFPLIFGIVQLFNHTANFFDCTQSFVVSLNCWHDGQVMRMQSQEPTFR